MVRRARGCTRRGMRACGCAMLPVLLGAACTSGDASDPTATTVTAATSSAGESTSGVSSPATGTQSDGTSTTAGSTDDTTVGSSEASSSVTSAETTGGPHPTGWDPRLDDYRLRCKLISDRDVEDPTANDTHHRFNLRGTDLGIPLVVDDVLHLFFGDTHGYRSIWAIGEDPDSVGMVSAAAFAADPDVLCSDLAFYMTPDDPSVAAGVDPSILRDFAAGTMTPPAGESLSSYITQFPPPFANIPGSFEVPSGALQSGADVYLFWAGKSEFQPHARMTLSYVARWDAPRTLPNYQIVRPFDALTEGPLGGHFLQVLPFVVDELVYTFGSGDFRHSGVHLARFPLAEIETGLGIEVFDATTAAWLDPTALDAATRAAVPPIFETDGVGELGGVFVQGPDQFLVMYQRELHDAAGAIVDNRIVVRTASQPVGPWSEAVTVIDMADPGFTGTHCCGAQGCEGSQVLNCFAAGLYAAYPLPVPDVVPRDDGGFEVRVPFVASTWNPYNVVLFEAQLQLDPVYD